MSHYLSEAFKKLDVLNEDTFAINTNGLEDFVKFEDADELEDSIDVIDTEAETIDDLQDSYVGKVILDCCVCHSKLYKDVEDVVIEDDTANANEECPFCYTTDGYKVIGQVASFDETEEKETEEKDDKIDEGLFGIKTKKEKEKEAKAKAQKEAQKQRDKELKDREERARQQAVADSWARRDKAERDAKAEYNRTRYNGIKGDKPSNTGYRGVNYSGGDYYSENLNESIDDVKAIKNLINSWVTGKNDGGGQHSAYFAKWLANAEPGLDDWEKIAEVAYLMGYDVYQTQCGYEGDRDYLIVHPNASPDIYKYDLDGTEDTAAWWEEAKKTLTLVESFENILKESVNNVNVETDEDVINVATDDNGKVTVTTEPKETFVDSEEVITPIEPEVQNEINDNVEDGGEIEIDMDEFDEESFDELGEGYLKKVYENVNSFKTANVSFIKNKLIVEGIIKFNSGKSKKTNFIFESREATKSGKVRFIGENKEIARGRKSFTITGRVDNKKFMSESFNYNYGVKDVNGKSQRLYGTVKRGK